MKSQGKIIVPLYITLPRKTKKDKKVALNLNWYRNVNFHTNNEVKKKFKEIVKPQLIGTNYTTPYWLCLTIYYSRLSDLDNWDAVITKYFNDAMVELWCVTDDNMEYFIEKHTIVWWIDKNNPRMEIEII